MTITDIERSLFKVLYDAFEVPHGIKIFDSVYYVDFETYEKWVVIDTLSSSAGPIPRDNFALHISTKKGLRNEKYILSRLVDSVAGLFAPLQRFDVYDDQTGLLKGDMEVCAATLLPLMQHGGGGSFRTLQIGLVYAGEVVG